MDDEDLHVAKGFADSVVGDLLWKNERGSQVFSKRAILPPCLKLVASNAAPPTEVNGDIYVIGNERGTLTASAIAWQSSNTVRYTFSGSPNLSVYNIGDYIIVTGAANSVHNGVFAITSVNDGSDYIQVTNTLVSSNAYDEGAGASAKSTLSNWDGCNQNSWVKYNSTDGLWKEIAPEESTLCYNKDVDDFIYFNGTSWQQYTFTNTKKFGNTIFVNSVTGSDTTGMVENIDKPFATIAAAHTASAAYYTGGNAPSATKVVTLVLIGNFSENVNIRPYHNYCVDGTTVTGSWSDVSYASACVCKIYGKGNLTYSGDLLYLTYGSTISIDVSSTSGTFSVQNSSATLYLRVFESATRTGKAIIYRPVGTVNVYNSTLSCTGAAAIKLWTSGTVRLINCQVSSNMEAVITDSTSANTSTLVVRESKLSTSGTNYDCINLTTNTGGNVYIQLKNCTLIANGTGNSIDAAQATNVRIYGSCETNLTHDSGNVTLLVGTVANGRFLIDTNVE